MFNFALTGLTSFDVSRQTCTFRFFFIMSEPEEISKFWSTMFSVCLWAGIYLFKMSRPEEKQKYVSEFRPKNMLWHMFIERKLITQIRMKQAAIDTKVFLTFKACVFGCNRVRLIRNRKWRACDKTRISYSHLWNTLKIIYGYYSTRALWLAAERALFSFIIQLHYVEYK